MVDDASSTDEVAAAFARATAALHVAAPLDSHQHPLTRSVRLIRGVCNCLLALGLLLALTLSIYAFLQL
jgi:hypothetical protein